MLFIQVNRSISVKAEDARLPIKEIINRVFQKYGGAIAMDCWTDAGKKMTYFGLTVHYISRVEGQLMLNDRGLTIRELSAETVKSGEYLRTKAMKNLREFDLADCIVRKLVFISDRGMNIASAVHSFNSVHYFSQLAIIIIRCENSKPANVFNVHAAWAFYKVQTVTSLAKYCSD